MKNVIKFIKSVKSVTRFANFDLFYFSRFMFINGICGNLIKINDGGELTITIKQKMKSDISL